MVVEKNCLYKVFIDGGICFNVVVSDIYGVLGRVMMKVFIFDKFSYEVFDCVNGCFRVSCEELFDVV